jgi:hypothetical protein
MQSRVQTSGREKNMSRFCALQGRRVQRMRRNRRCTARCTIWSTALLLAPVQPIICKTNAALMVPSAVVRYTYSAHQPPLSQKKDRKPNPASHPLVIVNFGDRRPAGAGARHVKTRRETRQAPAPRGLGRDASALAVALARLRCPVH